MTSPNNVPHPIPYQGSKRALAPRILSLAPRDVARLIEPFAGSAALTLAASRMGLAPLFWINDAHSPLVALWDEIVHRPSPLADAYERLWNDQRGRERVFFDQVRDRFNRDRKPGDFLYLLARCVKAAIRYNARGEFNNAPDNRRKGVRPEAMRRRITDAAALLAGRTRLTSGDYRNVLVECTPADLIYMDPPYQGVCRQRNSRYAPRFDHDEFHASLRELNRRGCRFLVSYDGRTGSKKHGRPLPAALRLLRLELRAGRSAQATLLGADAVTYESLYLSPALMETAACGR